MTVRYAAHRRDTCRICGGSSLEPYIDLGAQPPSNGFIRPSEVAAEQVFPLAVVLCRGCGFSQLTHVVESRAIFADYAYLSSTSKALCRHYQAMVDSLLARFVPPPGAFVCDIGANDGITLRCYPKNVYRLLGVEPSSAGAHARADGFEILDRFFDEGLGRAIAAERGGAHLITATNVFAHVDDIRSFAAGVAALLAPEGVYVVEFPYVGDMLENMYFDTIYHEHLSYLAFAPLKMLFEQVGLRMFDVTATDVGASGPAKRLLVCHRDAFHRESPAIAEALASEAAWGVAQPEAYLRFAGRVESAREKNLAMLDRIRGGGGRIGAYAAPAKGNTLLNFFRLGPDRIPAVSENNAEKVGKLTPGSHIPIVGDAEFLAMGFSHALLLAWNYADFFVANSAFVRAGGKFVVPLPEPVIRP